MTAPRVGVIAAPSTVRVVGIDPGARAALVCVDFPLVGGGILRNIAGTSVPRATLHVGGARWVGACTAAPSSSTKLTDAEQDARQGHAALELLDRWRPDLIVMEEPADVKVKTWQNAGRRGAGHGAAMIFAVGRSYGVLLMAVAAYAMIRDERTVRLVSYPVTTTKQGRARGRLGWMQGRANLPTPREETLETARLFARAAGAPPGEITMPKGGNDEDVLMATGVLLYHLQHGPALP